MEDQIYFIHPTAIVDIGASIGKGVKIWHFSHIMQAAKLGNDCIIGQNVFIAGGVSVGNRVKIQNNVSLYAGVIVEDDVFIGPSAVFTNVINPRSFIERKTEFRPTLVQKGAAIGANTTIICGISIGKYALIGAGAVVTRDVQAFALVVGNPARQIGWVSESGNRLEFDASGRAFSDDENRHYRLINGTVDVDN